VGAGRARLRWQGVSQQRVRTCRSVGDQEGAGKTVGGKVVADFSSFFCVF
jgi:hypothetical protein